MCCQPDPAGRVRTWSFEPGLPRIPVRISVSDARAEVYHDRMDLPPRPILLHAVVDSGASITVIKPHIAGLLRLEQHGHCYIGGVSDSVKPYPNYDIGIAILDPDGFTEFMRVGDMQAACIPLSSPGIDMLLGMDVLRNFEIGLNFRDRWISMKLLDFDGESNKSCQE